LEQLILTGRIAITGPAACRVFYAFLGLANTLLIVIFSFVICWILLGMVKTRPEFPKIVDTDHGKSERGFSFRIQNADRAVCDFP
jgi:hypothetical protein